MFSFIRQTFSLSFLIFMVLSPAMAQTFKVEKVKGNKAMIEITDGTLSPGRSYTFGGSEAVGEVATVAGPRRHLIGGSMDLQSFSVSSSTSGSTTSDSKLIQILTRYGWNFETSEFGFLLEYVNREPVTSSNSYVKSGLFYDYNFTPNTPGVTSIYGGAAEASYGSYSSSAAGSVAKLYASGFAKWFVFGPSTALRFDLGYSYEVGTFSTFTTTSKGFALRGGLSTYF